jgi:hypothetical protein
MEAKRRWPLSWRNGGTASHLRTARIQLGAAMIEAMQHGLPTVTLDLGEDATDLVFEALDHLDAAAEHAR